ncbi:MAG: hypothetical protein ACE5FI_15735 [Anaerolineales bacterium]
MTRRLLVLAILTLMPLSLSCAVITGLLGNDEEPAQIVIDIPEADPAGTGEEATTGEEGAPAPASLSASNNYGEPTGVQYYKTTLEFRSQLVHADGSETMGRIVANARRIVAPHALWMEFIAEGTASFQGDRFVLVQQDGTDYFVLPTGECVTFPSGQGNNPYNLLLRGGGMLGELEGALPVGPTEVVNGVEARHYTFDETNLDQSDPSTADVTAVQGDLWIVVVGDYVVRLRMQGRGSSEVLNGTTDESDLFYELNYYDFDVPVEVNTPSECAGAQDTDYPVLDDAKNLSSLPGIFTYVTGYDFMTAVDFYKAEMPLLGCTPDQELIAAPTATLGWNCPTGNVLVTVTQDPAGNGYQVGIIEEQG